MNRNEANALIQAFFRHCQTSSPGLNQNNFGAASVGEGQIYWEFQSANNHLLCSALIYRFTKPARPALLKECHNECANGADSGGGWLDYQEANQGLFLSRAYSKSPAPAEFIAQQQELLRASLWWSREVLDRVADKVVGK